MKADSNSSRLRNTKAIAELCEFEYRTHTHKFGGFFSIFQCEKIVKKIEQLKAREAELKREIEIITSLQERRE